MKRPQSLESARCLITGASSGLGRAIALELARQGAELLITGRSQERLAETAARVSHEFPNAPPCVVIPADLTRDQDRQHLANAVHDRWGALDLLVNSAGVGANGPIESHAPDVMSRIIDLNFLSLAQLTVLCLPLLCRGRSPAILNLGSVVARRGLPGRAAYSASKFALAGFSESIRAEWAKYGIHVLLFNPGFTNTEFEANLLANTSRYKVTDRRTTPPDYVARRALRALNQGKNEVTLSRDGLLLLAINRCLPRFVDHSFARWIRRLYPDAPLPDFHP